MTQLIITNHNYTTLDFVIFRGMNGLNRSSLVGSWDWWDFGTWDWELGHGTDDDEWRMELVVKVTRSFLSLFQWIKARDALPIPIPNPNPLTPITPFVVVTRDNEPWQSGERVRELPESRPLFCPLFRDPYLCDMTLPHPAARLSLTWWG
jgi:hypothetical protein